MIPGLRAAVLAGALAVAGCSTGASHVPLSVAELLAAEPPLAPSADELLFDDPAFANACLEAVAPNLRRLGWRLGAARLTRDPERGPIWRADFTSPEFDLPELVNRLSCWRRRNGELVISIAFGQAVPPLESGR